jgi:outer membrane protein assembly factor BamE (lipoprotein component of BamABCDE complex)
MIIRAIIISTTLIFSGCLSNNVLMSKSIAHNNLDKISQLEIGMTQNEVYQIMRSPANEDQVITGEGCYDIWFYITRSNALDPCHLVSRGLTPLVFKDGVFVGVGRQYYSQLVQKSKEPQLEPATPTKEEEERENIELEKTLMPSKKLPATSTPAKEEKRENLELEKTLTPTKKTPATTEPVKVKKQENLELEKTLSPPKKTPVAPVKPLKTNSKPLSMCSKPKRIESSTDQPADKKSNNDSSEPMLDEEDREMLDQVREENFNDW